MKRFLFIGIAALCVLAWATPVFAQAEATIWVQDVSMKPGDVAMTAVFIEMVPPERIAGFDITITSSNPSVAAITDANLIGFGFTHEEVVANGIRVVAVDTHGALQAGTPNVALATLEISGVASGQIYLQVTVNQFDDWNGDPINVTANDGVALVEAPTLPGVDRPVRDNNNDGLFEDMNGNGWSDFKDIILFFLNVNAPQVVDNAALFDFDDNGAVSPNDVVVLFMMVIGVS